MNQDCTLGLQGDPQRFDHLLIDVPSIFEAPDRSDSNVGEVGEEFLTEKKERAGGAELVSRHRYHPARLTKNALVVTADLDLTTSPCSHARLG